MLPKVSIKTVVKDELVDTIIDQAVADMGNATFGDGKIFVKEVVETVRIRTNERGNAAL
jgi:nitrogen regulatory protein P-II 1